MDEFSYGYYQTLRLEARAVIVSAFNRKVRTSDHNAKWSGMELASMDTEAVEYARLNWPKYYNGDTMQALPYSWEKLYMSYMRVPAHFNIAVWQTLGDRKILRGLALGRPSHAKTHLSINWLERSYEEPTFTGGVLLPILASAEHYAKLLGCERVLIKNALDPISFTKYGYAPSDDVERTPF